jgi:diguanylate cyclase
MECKALLAGEILSAGLTEARLRQQSSRDVRTDPLTGVPARQALDRQIQAEHERAARHKHPFCVAVVDVDRFRKINDTSGSDTGDQVLRQLTGIVQQEVRRTDFLARCGGDEFVVLMPETNLTDAMDAAERMRSRAEADLQSCGQAVTISCGVAAWSGLSGEGPADLLRRAREALHKAKSAGRNTVQAQEAA